MGSIFRLSAPLRSRLFDADTEPPCVSMRTDAMDSSGIEN